jgi:hypothetical protein
MPGDIDEPSIKEELWHKLRADLSQYFPETNNNKLLMCCWCGRFLPFEEFNLEHIVPKQALADDPIQVRINPEAPINARSELTLLCTKQLNIIGHTAYNNGCTSWNGRFFDKRVRGALNGRMLNSQANRLTERHIISLVCISHIAFFAAYGYQVVLTETGHLTREQFFIPNRFHKRMPLNCQMVLGTNTPPTFNHKYIGFLDQTI